MIVSLSLFASICSPLPSPPLLVPPFPSLPLLSSPFPSSSLCVSSFVLFLLLFLGIQLCCRSHSERQSTVSELSTKKLPLKNIDLEETCFPRYLPPFFAIYRTQPYPSHSTACCLRDSSPENRVKVAIYPLCV